MPGISFRLRTFAITGALAIALAGCVTKPVTAPVPKPSVEEGTVPTHPLTENKPTFLNLPNMGHEHTPVRVGIILPFATGAASVKTLSAAMLKAAQLALYDSGNRDIILMTADEGATPADAAGAATRLLDQGAEVLVGPLFAASVKAVSHEARDRGVPVLAFSTDRNVAGDGIYLMGFLPENDAARIASYAVDHGKKKIAALVPRTAYGDVAFKAFEDGVKDAHGMVEPVEKFDGTTAGIGEPAAKIGQADADAIFIPQGGSLLRAIGPALGVNDPSKTQLLGTGLWNDPANLREPSLRGGWFATVEPGEDQSFVNNYRHSFGTEPPTLAALSYDAISLIAVLSKGEPYKRFTRSALADPNGFAGVDGIFRFTPEGTAERGLAIVQVTPDGFKVVDHAPKTFQHPGP
jgi:ABC-type branched-subunit amino acid transport system substrate-binding protein